MACNESVVLPEDSGPNISIMRPRGYPPMPSAQSSPIEPTLPAHGHDRAARLPYGSPSPWPLATWPRVRVNTRNGRFVSVPGNGSFRAVAAWMPCGHTAVRWAAVCWQRPKCIHLRYFVFIWLFGILRYYRDRVHRGGFIRCWSLGSAIRRAAWVKPRPR